MVERTEAMLRKLGLVHLLTTGASRGMDAPPSADRAERLAEAYAEAGLAWAMVISSATKLAELLIGESDWAGARMLARVLVESDEAESAKHIGDLIENALHNRLSSLRVHGDMTAAEIRDAIAALQEDAGTWPRRALVVGWRALLFESVHKITQQKNRRPAADLAEERYSRYNSLLAYTTSADQFPEEEFFAGLLTVLDLCEG